MTGFTGVDPSHYDSFEPVACPMEVGDVLCFQSVHKQSAVACVFDQAPDSLLGGIEPPELSFTNVCLRLLLTDCFVGSHLTPHRALPNLSQKVRWSLDVRFERADLPTEKRLNDGISAACSWRSASSM